MRWRYVYPHDEFPYDKLLDENRHRDRTQPEFELLDTAETARGRPVSGALELAGRSLVVLSADG